MTNAEVRFNKSLRPRKPEGSLGRTAQDVQLDSHIAPELCQITGPRCLFMAHSTPPWPDVTGQSGGSAPGACTITRYQRPCTTLAVVSLLQQAMHPTSLTVGIARMRVVVVVMVRKLGRGVEGEPGKGWASWFLDFNVPSTVQGHLGTNHTFEISLHQFKTQVTKSQVCLIHYYNVKITHPSINAQLHIFLVRQKPLCIHSLVHIYIPHGNMLKSLVSMSRVTCFISPAHTGNCISYISVKK